MVQVEVFAGRSTSLHSTPNPFRLNSHQSRPSLDAGQYRVAIGQAHQRDSQEGDPWIYFLDA